MHTQTKPLKDKLLKCFSSLLKTTITFKKTREAQMSTLTLQPCLCTEALKAARLFNNKE